MQVLDDHTPRKVLIMLATSPITINSEAVSELPLSTVARRLRNYLTKPLPLLGGNATGVLMHVDWWLEDDPTGTLTASEFYDIAKYDADAVLPFGCFGLTSEIAKHLTQIIYEEQNNDNQNATNWQPNDNHHTG